MKHSNKQKFPRKICAALAGSRNNCAAHPSNPMENRIFRVGMLFA
jgi:hypothetical protein